MPLNSVPFFKVDTLAELELADRQMIGLVLENETVYYFDDVTEGWKAICTAGQGSSQLPIGFILSTLNSADPATYLGYGTWTAFAQGRMLIGVNPSDPDFDAAGETGGSKTVTLTEAQLPAHTHSVNDPGHTHVENQNSATTGPNAGWGARDTSTNTSVATGYSTASSTTGITLGNTGSGAAHDNMPPYIAVYMFQRTA